MSLDNDLDIAVIGMACRFPGAPSPEAYWANLRAGVESITTFSPEELRKSGVPEEAIADPRYVPAAGVMGDVEGFDAPLFGLSAREADILDPQQRIFLEVCWEALERAGYDSERAAGAIGVFGGASPSTYVRNLIGNPSLSDWASPLEVVLATDKDYLAPRVAYKLNLRGPALVVQTACSTSLVAVHLACQSLLSGECWMALAGGAAVGIPQAVGHFYEPDGIMSVDGHCRPFDASASGTVRGSGVGVVLLKRLSDALRDKDMVEAVIRGSATNNDGARRLGFTAPGVDGQAAVIRAAQAAGRVRASEVSYVEAHGTGTPLGDPIEVAALQKAFQGARPRSCAIGSVKGNFGHLDAAAGIAAFIKVVLMLKNHELVPSLHFQAPNPRIPWEGSAFYVGTRNLPWSSGVTPRRAGVSSFGIGGTNAHIVLEEAPPREPSAGPSGPQVLVLSARTEKALEALTDGMASHLETHPDLPLSDVAYTLEAGRRPFFHRRALVCDDRAEAARRLKSRDGTITARAADGRKVGFAFPGQGTQYVGMARGLFETQGEFREALEACASQFNPLMGRDLLALIHGEGKEEAGADRELRQTRFSQPALFATSYALARLWMERGLTPEAMIGHSIGEYVAACLAGVMSLEEAAGVVAERGRLMQACPPGGMTAVALAPAEVAASLPPSLEICVVNGPEATVVGGPGEELERLEERLAAAGIVFQRVATSHAFHSASMEGAVGPFREYVSRVRLSPPRIPFISNLTGTWISAEEATSPLYWTNQMRRPVQFGEGLGRLLKAGDWLIVEAGPGQTLSALARRRKAGVLAVPSLRNPRLNETDEGAFLRSLARLWTEGVRVKLPSRPARRVALPTYPFERRRHMVQPLAGAQAATPRRGDKLPLPRWFSQPTWRRGAVPPVDPGLAGERVCLLAREERDPVAEQLRGRGVGVSIVLPGGGYSRRAPGVHTIQPGQRADYALLLDALAQEGGVPRRFVHSWGLADPGLEEAVLSLFRLGQALGLRQTQKTELVVLSAGSQDVLGSEELSPLAAAALGPARVIPQEYPLLTCRTVDLPREGWRPEWAVGEILAGTEAAVAYRGAYRWLQSFAEVQPPAFGGAPLREKGVYLVTGGLGRVGLALAGHLARSCRARLVLTSRSGPEAGEGNGEAGVRADRLSELKAWGADVLVFKADVASPEEMGRALEAARERFGEVNGVIHAAADMGKGVFRPVGETDLTHLETALRAKLEGARVLDRLIGERPTDFVLITSSISTVLGGLTMAAYAGANHAVDAFVRQKHREGKSGWTSVSWDGWSQDAGPSPGISTAEGGEAFSLALRFLPAPQTIVSTTSLPQRLEQWVGEVGGGLEEPRPGDLHPRPSVSTEYVAPEDPIERRVAQIWGEILGIDSVGLNDNFFELGGSSLTALHLVARLRRECGGEISATTLFEAPTVRLLSQVAFLGASDAAGLERGRERGQQRMEARKGQVKGPNAGPG